MHCGQVGGEATLRRGRAVNLLDEDVWVRSPGTLRAVLAQVRRHVGAGALVPAPGSEEAYRDLVLAEQHGWWPDIVKCRFVTPSTGLEYTLSVDTYHGSGGWWLVHWTELNGERALRYIEENSLRGIRDERPAGEKAYLDPRGTGDWILDFPLSGEPPVPTARLRRIPPVPAPAETQPTHEEEPPRGPGILPMLLVGIAGGYLLGRFGGW